MVRIIIYFLLFYYLFIFNIYNRNNNTCIYLCAQFDKRNGSTRAEVVHDAIQVANIADLVNSIRA